MKSAQNREEWFTEKFSWLKKSFKAFLIGVPFAIIAAVIQNEWTTPVLILPFLFGLIWLIGVLCFIPIIHWKDRYTGQRTNLWGIFLVFETSGWTKIFYWFMHVLPDRKAEGPYAELE